MLSWSLEVMVPSGLLMGEPMGIDESIQEVVLLGNDKKK